MTRKNSGGYLTEIEEVFLLVCKVVGVCKAVPVHCTVYKYIVKIYVYESSDIISENNGHEPLECSRGITVSLLHSMAHKCVINGGKHCFPHIFGFHAYLFIRVQHIDL